MGEKSMEGLMEQYCRENPSRLMEEELCKIKNELLQPKKDTISDVCLEYKLWCMGLPSRQESFADYVMGQLPPAGGRLQPGRGQTLPGRGQKLLEVGGGRNGMLSLLLSRKGYDMTCMDPKLELEDGQGVRVIKEAFDYRTADLSPYEYVIAQEPCEAAEHVVRACTGQNVPFIMALCGVPHRLISGGMPEDVYAWDRYLNAIDSGKTELEVVKLYYIASVVIIKSRGISGQ